MPFCPDCGTEAQATHSFCVGCGRALPGTASWPPQAESAAAELDYVIPQARVLLLTVLTYGLYLFYWGYVTWRHYRDHAGGQQFPVWHGLGLAVPIYGLFRFHAHIRSFKELMDSASIASTLNAGSAVGFMIVSQVITAISVTLVNGSADPVTGRNFALAIMLLDALSIGIVAAVLSQAQDNINRFWMGLQGLRWIQARVGKSELLLCLVGILLWADTLFSVFSASYRGGL